MHEWSREEVAIIKTAWLEQSGAGRAALNLVVERLAGLMLPSFDSNALEMARKEGRRSVGVDLMRAINMPVEQVVKEPDEPRSNRPISATERSARIARGELTVPGR